MFQLTTTFTLVASGNNSDSNKAVCANIINIQGDPSFLAYSETLQCNASGTLQQATVMRSSNNPEVLQYGNLCPADKDLLTINQNGQQVQQCG